MNVTVSVGSASVAIGDALTTVSVYTTPGVMELLVIVGGVFPMDTVADRTGAPESFPSVGVTSHDTVSALANAVLFNVAVVGETYALLTSHRYENVTVSKSSSTAEPGVHVRVDAVVGVLGVSATLDKTGAVLSMTMLATTGVPLSVPSLGVTEQAVSPPTKLPEMLV